MVILVFTPMCLLENSFRSCRGLIILAMAVVLTQFGCRDANTTSASSPADQISDSDSGVEPLTVLAYENCFFSGIINEFEKEFSIPVELVTFSDRDEMEELLRSRPADFDLLVAGGGVVADLIGLQDLQPIQREKIPQFRNLDEQFLGLKFDPENRFSVPYTWGTTLIAYRKDKIEDPEKSWKSLWDERFRGRVLMVDAGFDVYAAALLASDHDINSQDPNHIEKATSLLVDQVKNLNARFVDILEVRDELLSGECWIGMTNSSEAALLADEEETIDYFIPEEGAPLWVDSFVIPRESTNSETAHLFLDFLCRAEVAAVNSNELLCASANRESVPFLNRETLENKTLYLHADVFARCRSEVQPSQERQVLVNTGLKQVFDQVREDAEKPILSLLLWEEYLAPEAAAAFEAATGARITLTEVENSEQLKQELASKPSAFDIVIADEVTLKELINLRLLRELNCKELSGMTILKDPIITSPADPDNRYSVPYLWGLTVLAGRSDVLKGIEPSWNLLWRDDLRIALLDEPSDIMWMALLALGHNPATATAEQVDEAAMRLAARFPDFSASMTDLLSGLDALEANEVDLVVSYNGDAIVRTAGKDGLEVIVPKEGSPLWLDSFAISRDARNPLLAHQFIKFMSNPETSAMTANSLHYASPNPEALAKVDPTLLANPTLYPADEMMRKCNFVKFPPEIEKYASQSILRLITESRSRTAVTTAAHADDSSSTRTTPGTFFTED